MRKNILVVVVFSLVAFTTKAQNVIVSPQWLNDNMSDPDLVIVQPSFLKLDYDNEHIKGARYLWPDWLTGKFTPGNL
jgi:3-mercaptopyruvate sulfurtransferase SseA